MKTMKHCALIKLTILLTLAVLLGSCASMYEGIVYDSSVPLERSAKITLANWKKDIIYNGVPVKCKTVAIITVPAGSATFTGYTAYDRVVGGRIVTYIMKEASFSCVLEAGKEYWVRTEYIDAEVPGYIIYGVGLYELEVKKGTKTPPKEDRIVFIPFDPQIVSR
jgi:hypothetical protein